MYKNSTTTEKFHFPGLAECESIMIVVGEIENFCYTFFFFQSNYSYDIFLIENLS